MSEINTTNDRNKHNCRKGKLCYARCKSYRDHVARQTSTLSQIVRCAIHPGRDQQRGI
jgi:hypothetical protein